MRKPGRPTTDPKPIRLAMRVSRADVANLKLSLKVEKARGEKAATLSTIAREAMRRGLASKGRP